MAEKASQESGGGWREMIASWEKGINALANDTMASDEFSSGANQSIGLALRMQQAMGAAMATYLATLNLPSRADVNAITERLVAIEAVMLRVAEALEGARPDVRSSRKRARPKMSAPRPPRTKRPPGAAPK